MPTIAGYLSLSEKFDITIVDGRDRVNCTKQSIKALSSDGVVVLDYLEREFYKKALDFMALHGFREITFTGIIPGLFYRKETTIFTGMTTASVFNDYKF